MSMPGRHSDRRRLCRAALGELPAAVRRPRFDPAELGIGIVHIGIGAFHRAHQAVYTEDAIDAEPGQWGILGVSLRHPDVAEKLLPQECLYTVETLGDNAKYRVIGALRNVLAAKERPEAVINAIGAENVHAITMTVTEKGYGLDSVGKIDMSSQDISADLRGEELPRSTLGWLARGLVQRYRSGRRPLTLISCDNLSRNGDKLHSSLIEFVSEIDRTVADWIANEIRCPNTMVDCIVPATDSAARERAEAALGGVVDLAPVQREEFAQWIIANHFAGPRPAWEAAGVQFVSDVTDFERLKLHVLNAAHSALAYLGLRRGHTYVREAIADIELAGFLDEMVAREIAPALAPLRAMEYWKLTKRRFANPRIDHALAQIAEDGSQKLAVRIFPILIENARAGLPTRHLAGVIRAWLEYARRPVKDRLRERLALWSAAGGSVTTALDDPALFPDPFRTDARARAAVEREQ